MPNVDRPEDRELAAELERTREPKSEHESLMRAIAHLTDAVLRCDATMSRLERTTERAIDRLVEAVNQCPFRPSVAAVGGE